MSDPSEIPNALTDEQWARREVEFGTEDAPEGWVAHEGMVALRSDTFDAVPGSFDRLGADGVYVGTYLKSGRASRFGISLDPSRAHAMAALCLYGQTFGFSATDVDDVRSGVFALREQGCDLIAAGLESLASRLSALLPKEKP